MSAHYLTENAKLAFELDRKIVCVLKQATVMAGRGGLFAFYSFDSVSYELLPLL